MAKHLVAVYDSFDQVRAAVDDLLTGGFAAEDISLIIRRSDPVVGVGQPALAVDDAEVGGAAGGAEALLDGHSGFSLPLRAYDMRDFGRAVGHGRIAERLADRDGDADFLTIMTDLGIKEERTEAFARAVEAGAILLAVDCTVATVQDAKLRMARHRPVNLQRHDGDWGSEPLTVFDRGRAPAAADTVGNERQPVDRLINTTGLDEREEYRDTPMQNYKDASDRPA